MELTSPPMNYCFTVVVFHSLKGTQQRDNQKRIYAGIPWQIHVIAVSFVLIVYELFLYDLFDC